MKPSQSLASDGQAVTPALPTAVKNNGNNGNNGHATPLVNTRVNILVVDDRADKLLAIESILEPLAENVVTARSGKEALRHLLKQEFAVILLDVAMPGMDGFETASLIRKRPRTEHTPIIFVTSISNSDVNIAEGYSLGAVDYILTPVVPEVLRAKVQVFVELHRKTELIKVQSEQLRRAEDVRHKRELAEVADQLEAETKRNRFFTLALDLLGIADYNGYLLQCNPSWEKVLGYPDEELKSKSGLQLVHPADHAAMREQFEKLQRDNFPIYFEARYQHKDGSYRWLGWTAAPFPAERLIYVFARDITARKAAEEEIQMLNGELRKRVNDLTEINKELETFNYSISHDLRAPLRSISSFTQVVRTQFETALTEEGLDYLRRVESAAKYMDRLLMDLLDYSRLSRSELTLDPMCIESAVDDVLFSIEQEIRGRNAEIEVRRPLGFVMGHPATVRQVFHNLIANALKFVENTRNPKVCVFTEDKGDQVRIWVTDCGIGIPPQYHKKIFGLFQRLHSRDAYPGTGIGLAMVQKGIERMGGRIGVESEPGKGSHFWIDLPRAEPFDTDQMLSLSFRGTE